MTHDTNQTPSFDRPTPGTGDDAAAGARSRRRPFRRLLWAAAALLAVATGVGAAAPHAHALGFGGPRMHRMSDERREAFMKRRLDHVLDDVKATDQQRAQIHAIFDRTAPQLRTLRGEHQTLRKELAQVMGADTVDGVKVEELRRRANGLVDRATGIVSRALVEAAQVLNKDQRKAVLAELAERHR